jgi:hypothetical protein
VPDNLWIVGDVQGYCTVLQRVLREAGLIDADGNWSGGSSILAVAGDLVDRGPDGIGVIELLTQLQQDAHVEVVIGNHDVQLLAAHRFGGEMVSDWLDAGGVASDLDRLTDAQAAWLSDLPAIRVINDALVLHADALFYADYGSTPDAVNAEFRRILHGDNLADWQRLLDRFGEHRAFFGPDGEANLRRFLTTFCGTRVVHGHTPIARMLGVPPESVVEAYEYCAGRAVNADPGVYLGGPGFTYHVK